MLSSESSNSVQHLTGITVLNHLDDKIKHIQVCYCESVKPNNSSYLYDFRTVNVETLENVSWMQTVQNKDNELTPENGEIELDEPVYFGSKRGYWQVYFTHGDQNYKIDKNNAMMNLSSEDNGTRLKITIRRVSRKNPKIRLDFQVKSGKAYFHAVVGNPIVRGISLSVYNELDQDFSEVSLATCETFSSSKDLDADSNLVSKRDIKFEKSDIAVRQKITSQERLQYTIHGRHYWELKFTHKDNCYRIGRKMAKFNLSSKYHGMNLDLVVCFGESNEICVEFRIQTEKKRFPCLLVRSVEDRNIEMSSLENYLDTQNVIARCSNRLYLIEYLRSVASELEMKYGHMEDRSRNTSDGNRQLFSKDTACGSHERFEICDEVPPEDHTKLKHLNVLKMLKGVKTRFDDEKKLVKELRNMSQKVEELFHKTKTAKDVFVNGFGCFVENLSVAGINAHGVVVNVGPKLPRMVNPNSLADVLEEEQRFLQGSEDVYDRYSLCCNALERELEKFSIIREELIKSLTEVANSLHQTHRNVAISKTSAAGAGIIGGGLICAGMILEPFTFGASTGLIIAGAAMIGVSSLTSIGTNICDGIMEKQWLGKLVELMEYDKRSLETLEKLERLRTIAERELSLSTSQSENCSRASSDFADKSNSIILERSSNIFNNTALRCVVDILRSPIGLIGIVNHGVSLSRGGNSELGYRLEIEALKLQMDMNSIASAVGQAIKEVAIEEEDRKYLQKQVHLVKRLQKCEVLDRELLEGSVATQFEDHLDSSKCPVCLDFFLDPRELECRHTVCIRCLKRIQAKPDDRRTEPDDVMNCPMCRSVVRLPEGGLARLPRNPDIPGRMESGLTWMESEFRKMELVPPTEMQSKTVERTKQKLNLKSNYSVTTRYCSKFDARLKHKLKLEQGSRVTGVTLFRKKLYVICENSTTISIFDAQSFKPLPSRIISTMKLPTDIASCTQASALFIADMGANRNCVWKVEEGNDGASKWLDGIEEPYTISITATGELLKFKCYACWHLIVYDTRESKAGLIKSIKLPKEIRQPLFGVQLSSGDFAICYGSGDLKVLSGQRSEWRISHLSPSGQIVRTLMSVTLSGPLYYMTLGAGNELFLSEGGTNTLIRLDSELSIVRTLAKPDSEKVNSTPWKLCCSEVDRMLIVGDAANFIDVYAL